MNKQIMKSMGFIEAVNSVEAGNCPFCKQPIDLNSFRDQLSKKEFNISGLCQSCQDKIFDD